MFGPAGEFFAVHCQSSDSSRCIFISLAKNSPKKKIIINTCGVIIYEKVYLWIGTLVLAAETCLGLRKTKRSKNRTRVKSCRGSPAYWICVSSIICLAKRATWKDTWSEKKFLIREKFIIVYRWVEMFSQEIHFPKSTRLLRFSEKWIAN